MPIWWRDPLSDENPLSDTIPTLDAACELTHVKTQYDALYNTQQEKLLRQRNETQIVKGGIMTHYCCETTARSSFIRGFEVFLTMAGAATYSLALHFVALLNLAYGFAKPVLVEDIIAVFPGRDR